MVVAFLVAFVGLPVVAALLKLSLIGSAAFGQVGILAVAFAFAAFDGDGFRPLGFLGKWKDYDIGIIIGLMAVNFLGSLAMAPLIMKLTPGVMEGSSASTLLKSFGDYSTGTFTLIAFGTALMAGVSEEMLFRGYLISRLERLGLPGWVCVVGSGLVFGLVHWPGYGLLSALSKGIFFGIPTGLYFWKRRNLGPLVAAHGLMDFFGFMLAHVAARYFPNLPMT